MQKILRDKDFSGEIREQYVKNSEELDFFSGEIRGTFLGKL